MRQVFCLASFCDTSATLRYRVMGGRSGAGDGLAIGGVGQKGKSAFHFHVPRSHGDPEEIIGNLSPCLCASVARQRKNVKAGLTRQGACLAGQRSSLGAQGARSRTHGPLIVIGAPLPSVPVNLVCV
jgi:hypothetical protein